MRTFASTTRRLLQSLQKTTPKFNMVNYKGFKIQNFASLIPNNKFYFANVTINVPKMGDSITEGTVLEYKKNVGEFVKLDEIVAIVETDKVQVEVRNTTQGVLTKLYAQKGDTILVDKPFFDIDSAGQPSAATAEKPKQAADKPAPQQAQTQAPPKAQTPPPQQQQAKTEAPAVKETPKAESKPAAKPQQGSSLPPVQGFKSRNEKREPMSRMRLKISERLKQAQNTYALLTTFQECDMSAVMELRTQLQNDFTKKHGVKLGFMSLFLKASVSALQTQPVVNAVIDGKDIVYRDYCDISVAVSTPTGLMVPVLRNCESQSIAQLEKSLLDLADKGRTGKITLEDMAGGTFTISNGGVFGSMMGTPILNPPQSAILGMHSIQQRAVVRGDSIVARPIMYLALTYDHRLIDGREAVTFLKQIRDEIEDPRRLLLDL